MKKVISLSAVIMLSFAAFAQDTIPKSNSNKNNNLDTMRHNNNLPKDTASKNWNNTIHRDSTTSTTSSNTISSDSMNTSNSANSNSTTPSTMNSDSSTMASGNHTMDSTGRASSNHSNTTTATTTTSTKNTEDSVKAYEKTLTDRVMMKDDKMYMLKDGEATLLEKSYKLSSGAIVSTLGSVKYPGGRVLTLKNGQFIEIKPVAKETETKTINKNKKSTKSVVSKKRVKTQSK